MKLSKIDLSNIVAVGHADDYLKLLIDRGEDIEYVEIPAPFAAYQGLQQINSLAATEVSSLPTPPSPAELAAAPKPLAMLPVNSSMAKAIGYDNESKLLQVEFNSGSVYQYEDVDQDTWNSLQATDSTGKFYNSEIKGNYSCRRVDETTEIEAISVDYLEEFDYLDELDLEEDY